MKRYIVFITLISCCIFIFACMPQTQHSEETPHNCIKCHKMTKDDALALLKDKARIQDAKIIDVSPEPVKGLWEISFEAGSKKAIGYVDYSKNKIVFGNVFDMVAKTNLTAEKIAALNKIDNIAQISVNEAIVMGNKNTATRVIVFSDPD